MSTSEQPPTARLVLYSGRVQGVGFRMTAAHLARRFAVTGWVRNLPDGRVRLLAEGPVGEVRLFLDAVRGEFADCIDAEEGEDQPLTGQYRSFEIVH
jgi:acylphosphatase